MSRDHLLRAILPEHDLRVLVVHATDLVAEAGRIQGCSPGVARIFAETLIGACLHASLGKDEKRTSLQLEGRGPLHGLFADASAEGAIRGFVKKPDAELDPLDLREAVGPQAYLSVLRELPDGEFYRAAVAVDEKRLDRCLEHYFKVSEQIDTALSIEVETGADGTIVRAVGLLVQRLPDGDAAAVKTVRERLAAGALLDGMKSESGTGTQVARLALEGLGELEVLADVPLAYRCSCSRPRARRGLSGAGRDELLDMVVRDRGAELGCEFCKTVYRFEAEELLQLVDELEAQAD